MREFYYAKNSTGPADCWAADSGLYYVFSAGEIPIELVINGEIIETDTPVITETIDEEEVLYIPQL
jgi:hypothetical protein